MQGLVVCVGGSACSVVVRCRHCLACSVHATCRVGFMSQRAPISTRTLRCGPRVMCCVHPLRTAAPRLPPRVGVAPLQQQQQQVVVVVAVLVVPLAVALV